MGAITPRSLKLGDTINLAYIEKYACKEYKAHSQYHAYSRVYGTRDQVIDPELIRWGVHRRMDIPFMSMVRPKLAHRYSEARQEIIEKYGKLLLDVTASPSMFKLDQHQRLIAARTDEIVNLVVEYLSTPTGRNLSQKSTKKE